MTTYIIDDSAWDTPNLSLSPGWNMIGPDAGGDHFLNANEPDAASPGPIQRADCELDDGQVSSNEILFNGTGIEVYGMTGPSQGVFSAVLDGKLLGGYNGHAAVDAQHLLLASKGLASGPHNLTMINLEEGKALTFDYAVVETGVGSTAPSPANSSVATSTSPSPAATTTRGPAAIFFPATTSAPSTSTAHPFTWTPLAIFILAFGSFISLSSMIGMLYFFLVVRKRQPRGLDQEPGAKQGRRRTLLQALASRRIGAPKPKEATLRDFRMDSDGSVRNVGLAYVKKDGIEWDDDVEEKRTGV